MHEAKVSSWNKCTNLLQHQEALAIGVVELYKRLVRGQRWDGGPIEEVNGEPSVHIILERLGVLDHDEDAYKPDLCFINHRAEHISPVGLTRPFVPTTTAKTKRAVRLGKRTEPACPAPVAVLPEQQSFVVHSPKSATATTMSQTSITCGPPPSALDADKVLAQSTYFPQLSSPLTPLSDARSVSLSHCWAGPFNTSTAMTYWVDSPGNAFCDQLFGTPISTDVQPLQQQSDHQIEPLIQAQPQGQIVPIHQDPYIMPPSYASPNLNATETYNPELFFDSTLGQGDGYV
ncbi:hypothetical protein CLAIMM_14793 isoform 1 [Cladophialophora immunda]|nr:hypothetical protein CLAIMM_14793 isoform 1 [Cladophialophora immunda]